MLASSLIKALNWHLAEYGDQETVIQTLDGQSVIGAVGLFANEDENPPLELITINSAEYMLKLRGKNDQTIPI